MCNKTLILNGGYPGFTDSSRKQPRIYANVSDLTKGYFGHGYFFHLQLLYLVKIIK